jgi:hypothetical protein
MRRQQGLCIGRAYRRMLPVSAINLGQRRPFYAIPSQFAFFWLEQDVGWHFLRLLLKMIILQDMNRMHETTPRTIDNGASGGPKKARAILYK